MNAASGTCGAVFSIPWRDAISKPTRGYGSDWGTQLGKGDAFVMLWR